MSRRFLEELNGDRDGAFRSFLDRTKPEPDICWYPSAGEDFHDVLYLDRAYARLHPASGPDESFPDIFIHTDHNGKILAGFQKGDSILVDDGRTRISLERDTMDALAPVGSDDPVPSGDTRHGEVLYFQLNVECSVGRHHQYDTRGLQDFRFDPDTDRWHWRYKAHVLHVCMENSAFLRKIMEIDTRLSHAYFHRDPIRWFGKPIFPFLDDHSAFLPWLGCRHVVTVGAEEIPPYWHIIRSRVKPHYSPRINWFRMDRWDKAHFLEYMKHDDSEFVFWDLTKLTEPELQDLMDCCRKGNRFNSILIPVIGANLPSEEFESAVLPRMFRYLISSGRWKLVGELLGLSSALQASCRHLTSELRILPASEALMALETIGPRSYGLLDYEGVAGDRGEEMYNALKDWPFGIRHFDATSVPQAAHDDLNAFLGRMVLRKNLRLRRLQKWSWYEVEYLGR